VCALIREAEEVLEPLIGIVICCFLGGRPGGAGGIGVADGGAELDRGEGWRQAEHVALMIGKDVLIQLEDRGRLIAEDVLQ
jgi:hypothetical protein